MEERNYELVAKAKGWTVEAIVASPGRLKPYDRNQVGFFAQHKAELEQALLARVVTAPQSERLDIARALIATGCASGVALVVGELSHTAGAGVALCLDPLVRGGWLASEACEAYGLPALAQALVRHKTAPDRSARKQLAYALTRISLPEATDCLRGMLTDEDFDVRQAVACHLASESGDPAALPQMEAMVLDQAGAPIRNSQHVLRCFAGFARHPDQQVRLRAAGVARRRLTAVLGEASASVGQDAWDLVRALDELAPEQEDEFLQEVSESSATPWARRAADERIALKSGGDALRRRALLWLRDPARARDGLELVSKAGPAARDPEIEAVLWAELESSLAPERTAEMSWRSPDDRAVVSALVAIGLKDDPRLLEAADRAQPWTRFEILMRAGRVSPEAVLDAMEKAALLAPEAREIRNEFLAGLSETNLGWPVLKLLSQGRRLVALDRKGGESPPDYAYLLARMIDCFQGEISLGETAVKLADEGTCTVTTLLAGRTVHLTVQDQGRWFDLDGFVVAVNGALSACVTPLRFFCLARTDQMGLVVLADAGAVPALVRECGFPILVA